MRVLDLFSGIGGFSLGLERAGLTTVKFIENDPDCQKVLRHHWPDIPIHSNIKTYQPSFGEAEVICGGFPCQPFSTASRGKKTAEDLWPEMRRVINEVRPIWVIAENVNGIDPEYPCRELEDIDYTVWTLSVDASPRGRRHRRRRYIFVAHSNLYGEPKCTFNEKAQILQECPRRGWWDQSFPLGVANGLSRRLDRRRMKQLGNSLSPVISEGIGKAIMEVYHE